VTVFRGLTQPKLFMQVYYRSLGADGFESGNSPHWDGGALPKRSVAHLQRQRSECARTGPVLARLKPEVMCCDNRRLRTQQCQVQYRTTMIQNHSLHVIWQVTGGDRYQLKDRC